MALFRLLQVSDLHIGATPEQLGFLHFVGAGFKLSGSSGVVKVSSHSEEILDGLALRAWIDGHALDGIIITGDLATTGGHADVKAASTVLLGPHSSSVPWWTADGTPTLDNPHNLKMYLIPGNHDRYDGPMMLPGGKEFDTFFGSSGNAEWPVGQFAHKFGVLPKGGVSLGIVGGDLSLRDSLHINPLNPTQVWGTGRAYRDVIDEMVRLTDEIRNENDPVEVIWLVHFPPQFPNQTNCLQLHKEDRLIQAAHGADVNFLLAGHTHKEARYLVQQPGAIIHSAAKSFTVHCAGTATEHRLPGSSSPRTIHLLEFDFDGSGPASLTSTTLNWSDLMSDWV
jgi:hypothetical protein